MNIFLHDPSGFLAVFLAGLVFSALNLWLLSRIIRALGRAESTPVWKTALLFFLKMGLIFGTIGLLLKKGYVSPLPFLAGFTVSLVLGLALLALKNKQENKNASF